MTRIEFNSVVTYIGLACRQELSSESMEVYFDLLGDLDVSTLQTAARRALLEHHWPTFPTVAELREAAADTMQGQVKGLSATEAWALAWDAVSKIDPEVGGPYHVGDKVYPNQAASILAHLPPLVAETIKALGLPALCYGKEPVAVVRAQFLKAFAELAARDKREALLPPGVRESIEAKGQALPPVARALAGVGKMPDATD